MKWPSTILRYFIISLELLIILCGLAFYTFYPNYLLWLSERIGSQAELLKYFGLLPAGLVVYDSNIVKSLLLPDADKKMILQKWNLYWNFKCGCMVGLIYGFIFTLAGIAALLFNWQIPAAYQSAVLATSVAGAVTVSATLYYANICMEEHFRKYSTSEPHE